ncbi:MAG TPA: branched-chain amino acid ABC transporter permease [Ilumatobacter sp.]|nr:branched-chain amino acid ABC transporter permease [Ilumatobacter sp.]
MNFMSVIESTLAQLVGRNACYYAIAAIGLNVQFGYAGLLNFGQAAFMAAGAYGLAQTLPVLGISLWWGIALGVGYSIVLGVLMGLPTLRLRADYLAIVTIAVAEIVRLVVRSQSATRVFGGSNGLQTFSRQFRQLGIDLGIAPGKTYGFWAFRFSGRDLWVLIVGWSLVVIFGVLVWLLMRSPWGRILKAIREDEDAVRSLGKNVYSYKMQALVLGGVIGTFGGMIIAIGADSVQPDNFSRDLTFYVLTGLVLGGIAKVTGSIVGPMLFWALYAFLDSFLRQLIGNKPVRIGNTTIISTVQVGPVVFMLMGALLVTLMVYRPQGLFGNRKEMAFDGR